MKPRDFAVDPTYLIGTERLQWIALILGTIVLLLWVTTLLRNGRAGWYLTRHTCLDILRTRLYWIITICAILGSIGTVLLMFLKAYPDMQQEGVSGVELVAGLYLFSDTPQNVPSPGDAAAAARDLKEGVTLLTSIFLQALFVFFGSLLAIFTGMGLLANELERRSIYTLISKPLDRMMIFFGKLGGCYAALACYACVVWVVDAALLAYFGLGVRLNILPAFLVGALVPMILATLTLFLSTRTWALVAGFLSIVLMFASNNAGTGTLKFILTSVMRRPGDEVDWVFLLLPPQRPVGLYSVNFLIEDPLTRFFVSRAFPITADPAILALPVVYLSVILLCAYLTFRKQEFN